LKERQRRLRLSRKGRIKVHKSGLAIHLTRIVPRSKMLATDYNIMKSRQMSVQPVLVFGKKMTQMNG